MVFLILGGGITGLALAWFLRQKHGQAIEIILIEKEKRLGGWIQTVHEGGFCFDQGPHSIRVSSDAIQTLRLIEALNLQDQVIFAHPSSRQRFLYANKQLIPLPKSVPSLLFSRFFPLIVNGLWRDWHASRGDEDETILSFVKRRLGNEIAEQFVDPLISGIYAGEIDKLSMKSCLPKLWEWEQEQGSLWRGVFKQKQPSSGGESSFVRRMLKQRIFSFSQGMETLPKALSKALDAQVLLDSEVQHLKNNPHGLEVELTNGKTLTAHRVFGTLSAQNWSTLWKRSHPHLSSRFNSIPYASVAVVNLGYQHNVLRQSGFGYLVPSREEETLMGVIWDSSVFPQQNTFPQQTRLTVMIGGTRMSNFDQLCVEKAKEIALEGVQRHLHIHQLPEAVMVKRASQAIPQYLPGHDRHIKQLQQDVAKLFPHLTLLGPLVKGVSIHNCILSAYETAQNS